MELYPFLLIINLIEELFRCVVLTVSSFSVSSQTRHFCDFIFVFVIFDWQIEGNRN